MYWVNNEDLEKDYLNLDENHIDFKENKFNKEKYSIEPLGCLIRICFTKADPCYIEY